MLGKAGKLSGSLCSNEIILGILVAVAGQGSKKQMSGGRDRAVRVAATLEYGSKEK